MTASGHNSQHMPNIPRQLEFAVMYSDLPPLSRLIVHVLTKLMKRDGTGCYPSIDTLASLTGMGRRSVVNHLKNIDEWGDNLKTGKPISQVSGVGTRPNFYVPNIDNIEGALNARSAQDALLSEFSNAQDAPLGSAGDAPQDASSASGSCSGAGDALNSRYTVDIKEKEKISKKEKQKILGHAFDEYNELAERVGLPVAVKLTDTRRTNLWARLRDYNYSGWLKAIDAVEASSWLCGENDRNWKCNLDFLLQASSYQKLIEGVYDTERDDGKSPKWGWWRTKPLEKYHALPMDYWRNRIKSVKPNGKWPWPELGPPPGHPECLLPAEASKAYGNKYADDVKALIAHFGGNP